MQIRRFAAVFLASTLLACPQSSAKEAAAATREAAPNQRAEAPDDSSSIRVSGMYDFYVGGLRIAEISLDAEIGDERYTARSAAGTRGILRLLFRGNLRNAVDGTRGRYGRLVPGRFESLYSERSGKQLLTVEYNGYTPAKVKIEPAEPVQPYSIKATEQHGTLDPLSAALITALPSNKAQLCDRTVPVFDGKRRFDLIFLPPDPERFDSEMNTPEWDRPLVRCLGVYERIAGFEEDPAKGGKYFPFDIWFEDTGNGVYRAVRLAGKTTLGFAIGSLRAE